jgi:hypothetical protein
LLHCREPSLKICTAEKGPLKNKLFKINADNLFWRLQQTFGRYRIHMRKIYIVENISGLFGDVTLNIREYLCGVQKKPEPLFVNV